MHRYFLKLVIVMFSSTIFFVHSGSNNNVYDYRRTVAIVHIDNSGGIIYQRPKEVNERNYFIILNAILEKYIPTFTIDHNSESAVYVPPDHDKLLLINDQHVQTLYIGDSWLSDGKIIVPMAPEDYQKFKLALDSRTRSGHPASESVYKNYIANIHKEYAENYEQFDNAYGLGESEKVTDKNSKTGTPAIKDTQPQYAQETEISSAIKSIHARPVGGVSTEEIQPSKQTTKELAVPESTLNQRIQLSTESKSTLSKSPNLNRIVAVLLFLFILILLTRYIYRAK